MLVKCTIRAASRTTSPNDSSKVFGRVTVETSNPLQIHELTMFGQSMSDGTFDQITRHIGREVVLPLVLEEYKGKTSLRIAMNEKIEFPAAPAVARAAS